MDWRVIARFRCIDVETTGTSEDVAVVECGWTDLMFDTDDRTWSLQPTESELFGAPGSVPPEAMAVHHIAPSMIDDRDPFDVDVARFLARIWEPMFLVAHNAAFEQRFFPTDLIGQARWICTFKSALRVWPDAPGHGNQTLRYWLGLSLTEELATPTHRAGPDSYVTANILGRLLSTERAADLVRWTLMPRVYPTCPLGRHRGQPWSAVPHDFLTWMLNGARDLEADLREAANTEIERRKALT